MLIGNKKLEIQELENFVSADDAAITIHAEALRNAEQSFLFLAHFSADTRLCLAINMQFHIRMR